MKLFQGDGIMLPGGHRVPLALLAVVIGALGLLVVLKTRSAGSAAALPIAASGTTGADLSGSLNALQGQFSSSIGQLQGQLAKDESAIAGVTAQNLGLLDQLHASAAAVTDLHGQLAAGLDAQNGLGQQLRTEQGAVTDLQAQVHALQTPPPVPPPAPAGAPPGPVQYGRIGQESYAGFAYGLYRAGPGETASTFANEIYPGAGTGLGVLREWNPLLPSDPNANITGDLITIPSSPLAPVINRPGFP